MCDRSGLGLPARRTSKVARARLLVLASTFPAGDGDSTPAFVRDLAAIEAGEFDTTVLVPAVRGGASRERVGAMDVVRFRYFPRRWEDVADGAILENLRARPSRWLQVPLLLAAETIALARAVHRLRPDVLHVHWLLPQGLAALLAARNVPTLVTCHGGDVYALTDPLSRHIMRRVLRRASQVTTMNSEMRDRVLELGADPDRTHILSMGADIAAVRAGGVGIARRSRQLLFVGRLVEKKGVRVLLDALRELPDELGVVLRIVGDGPLRAELEQRAHGLRVEFLGALPRSEVAREFAASAIAMFPSVRAASGDQDGLPVALLEALAAGCAVVASDLPGLNDAIQHGRSGLLVPPGDASALANAIAELLQDSARREQLGIGASARAEAFSVTATGGCYVELLAASCRPA